MKKISIIAILTLAAAGMVFAEAANDNPKTVPAPSAQTRQKQRNNRPAPEQVTISGNLTLVKGMLAVQSSDITYFVGGLKQYVGFIDALKEGASVTLEGAAFSLPAPRDPAKADATTIPSNAANANSKILRVTKLTLGGKSYDVDSPLSKGFAGGKNHPRPNPGKRRNGPKAPQNGPVQKK